MAAIWHLLKTLQIFLALSLYELKAIVYRSTIISPPYEPVREPTAFWRKKLKANETFIVADFQCKTSTCYRRLRNEKLQW